VTTKKENFGSHRPSPSAVCSAELNKITSSHWY